MTRSFSLKRAGGGNYVGELLARIRDIRSSEKVFWRKVLDSYATSIVFLIPALCSLRSLVAKSLLSPLSIGGLANSA